MKHMIMLIILGFLRLWRLVQHVFDGCSCGPCNVSDLAANCSVHDIPPPMEAARSR